jgi:hypothetical protein
MTWKSATPEELEHYRQVMLWITTVRETGAKYNLLGYGSDWLPSEADFAKSALLERIRSGLAPMVEPPPVGYSCPWYALVEDAGPHYIFDVSTDADWLEEDQVLAAQNRFTIYERRGEKDFIVGDIRGTSYRFRLWFDAEWNHPTGFRKGQGGWFMQNVKFAFPD